MSYKMRIRIAVDVDITAPDSTMAFDKLMEVKRELRDVKFMCDLAGTAKVVDARTDAMIREEEDR